MRLERRTPWFVSYKQQGSKIHSAVEQRKRNFFGWHAWAAIQLIAKAVFANVSSNTRAVEYIHMATPSGWKVAYIIISVFFL